MWLFVLPHYIISCVSYYKYSVHVKYHEKLLSVLCNNIAS